MTDAERQKYTQNNQGRRFQHKDGGIYAFHEFGTMTTDGTTVHVAYYHVWPFERKLWLRPEAEWTVDRFTPITDEFATHVMVAQSRAEAQATIKAKREARKAAENTAT